MIERLDRHRFDARVAELIEWDEVLARSVARFGPPDFWHRPPGIATLALLVVEQQVSLASAKAVFERLVDLLGEVTAATLEAAADADLAAAGLTRQKRRYLKQLARRVGEGSLPLDALDGMDDLRARRELLTVTGIGPWTADVYLLSALCRPDVWPSSDRALQLGARDLLGLSRVPGPAELDELGARWRPHRSVVARLIWHDYLGRRGRRETDVRGLNPRDEGDSALASPP